MAWVKGQSGNPSGRPQGSISVVALLLRKLRQKGPDGKRQAEAVAEELLDLALHGRSGKVRLDAITAIMERTDGKVTERMEHSGPDGRPLLLEYVNDWRKHDFFEDPATLPAPGPGNGKARVAPLQLAGGGEAVAEDDSRNGHSG